MAGKPESVWTAGLHKHFPVPSKLHREKMNNPYRGGTADWWYSGTALDLWAEYKFLPRIPVRANIKFDLSQLQLDWLRLRYAEGRNVCVIVGVKGSQGILLTDLEWERQDMTPTEFLSRLQDRRDIAHTIVLHTLEGLNCCRNSSSQRTPRGISTK